MFEVAEGELIRARTDDSLLEDAVGQVVDVAADAAGKDGFDVDGPLEVRPALAPCLGTLQGGCSGRVLQMSLFFVFTFRRRAVRQLVLLVVLDSITIFACSVRFQLQFNQKTLHTKFLEFCLASRES